LPCCVRRSERNGRAKYSSSRARVTVRIGRSNSPCWKIVSTTTREPSSVGWATKSTASPSSAEPTMGSEMFDPCAISTS
jgi:hypothetical protein